MDRKKKGVVVEDTTAPQSRIGVKDTEGMMG